MSRGLGFVVILTALLALGCSNFLKGKAAAERQAEVFHNQFNNKDFESIIAEADPEFTKVSPKSEVIELLTVVRQKLGKAIDSKVVNWNVRSFNFVTNAVLVQETTFEQGMGTETFTFRIKKEQAALLGYHINSRELIMK